MNKRLWIVLIAIVAIAFGGAIWSKNQNKDTVDALSYVSKLDANKLLTADDVAKAIKETEKRDVSDKEKASIIPDHYLGNKDAKVKVYVYENFACPFCQAFNTYAKKIEEDYKDQVLFIYRNFKLPAQYHPNSPVTLAAGEAAYLAGGNEAFWKFGNLLFKDEKWVSSAVDIKERSKIFNDYAKQAGLDVDRFNSYLEAASNNGIQDKIDRDTKLGEAMKVSGTPTWIVNGKKVSKIADEEIRNAIKEALKAK